MAKIIIKRFAFANKHFQIIDVDYKQIYAELDEEIRTSHEPVAASHSFESNFLTVVIVLEPIHQKSDDPLDKPLRWTASA